LSREPTALPAQESILFTPTLQSIETGLAETTIPVRSSTAESGAGSVGYSEASVAEAGKPDNVSQATTVVASSITESKPSKRSRTPTASPRIKPQLERGRQIKRRGSVSSRKRTRSYPRQSPGIFRHEKSQQAEKKNGPIGSSRRPSRGPSRRRARIVIGHTEDEEYYTDYTDGPGSPIRPSTFTKYSPPQGAPGKVWKAHRRNTRPGSDRDDDNYSSFQERQIEPITININLPSTLGTDEVTSTHAVSHASAPEVSPSPKDGNASFLEDSSGSLSSTEDVEIISGLESYLEVLRERNEKRLLNAYRVLSWIDKRGKYV